MGGECVLGRLAGITDLPAVPVVVRELQVVMPDPTASMHQMAAVLAKDQAIASRVIRVVNSAFYGFQEPIRLSVGDCFVSCVDVSQKVKRATGLSTLRSTATEEDWPLRRQAGWFHPACHCDSWPQCPEKSGNRRVGRKGLQQGAPPRRFRPREVLAPHPRLRCRCTNDRPALERPDREDYFLAGLMHDLDILVIEQYLHAEYVKIVVRPGRSYLVAEQAVLGAGHGEVGGYLAGRWRLPEFPQHAIVYHHSPGALPESAALSADKIAVVHIADAWTERLGLGKPVGCYGDSLDHDSVAGLHLSEKCLEGLLGGVKDEVASLARVWDIRSPTIKNPSGGYRA